MTRRERRHAQTTVSAANEEGYPELALRRKAEAMAVEMGKAAPSMEAFDVVPPENLRRMVHELRVSQIELEMQNEQLRETLIELDALRARYFNFYDLAPVGYVSVAENGLILQANLTTAHLLGVARHALLDRSFSRFIHKQDADIFHLHRRHLFETGQPHACELRMVKQGGAQFWARLEAIAVQEDDGALEYRVVLSDISERKQAEQALAESEQRFALFMDNLPAAAFITGENNVMLYANRHLEQFVGGRECVGKTAKDLFPPDMAEKMLRDNRSALEAGSIVTEGQVSSEDGQLKFYQTHKFVIPRPGRHPLLGGIALDITARKQAEEQLRKIAETLERRVNERERQLRGISAQLTMTEERERRLLAQDLHDNLHQLLFAIKIRLGLLVDGSPRSAFDRIGEMVAEADLAARSITHQLSPPILRTLGLLPALEWLAGEMADSFGLNVHFKCDCLPPPQVAEVQAILFRSVRELLINVAKHAKVSEAGLSCECDGSRMTLVVSDDGCGFDPVPDPDAPMSVQHSFGLGVIYERIVNIGGTMEVVSGPGRGTRITLAMPHSLAQAESET